MLQIEIKAGNLEALTRIQLALENLDPLLDEAGAFLLNRIRTRFLAEMAPDDVPWIPSRAAIERRKHGGTGTLYDTGRLFHSIQLAKVGDDRVIGTDVPYGAQHQLGDPAHGIIQRMFLGFSEGDVDVLSKLLIDRLGGIIEEAVQ